MGKKHKMHKDLAALSESKTAAGAQRRKAEASSAEQSLKLIRDSFTMPTEDFALIAELKERTLEHKRPTKKSELLRAGLQVLARLPDAQLLQVLDSLRPLKPGRPKKKR